MKDITSRIQTNISLYRKSVSLKEYQLLLKLLHLLVQIVDGAPVGRYRAQQLHELVLHQGTVVGAIVGNGLVVVGGE